MDSASFIKKVVEEILGKSLSSFKNYDYGGSYNTIKQAVIRNNSVGKIVALMISNMIINELFDFKKYNAIEYLKHFLSEHELKEFKYMKYNPDDIKRLVFLVTEKINKNRNKQIVKRDSLYAGIRMVKFDELIELGWTYESYIQDCLSLWEKTVDIPEEHNGDLEQWLPIIKNYPKNREILLNENNKFIGYWNFEPLFDDIFEKAKKGELLDGELHTEMIPPFLDGKYNIYIISVMIREDYRGEAVALKKILLSMIEYVECLSKENIFINKICAWAYTSAGISLAKHIGLKFHKNHVETGKIYLGNIQDLLDQPICKSFVELKKIYKCRKGYKNEF